MGQTAAIFVTQVTNSNSLLTGRESLISDINMQVCNVVLLCFLIPVNCLFTLVNMLHNYQLTHLLTPVHLHLMCIGLHLRTVSGLNRQIVRLLRDKGHHHWFPFRGSSCHRGWLTSLQEM